MKIKKKLFLGFGTLFIVVLIFGAVSIYYVEVITATANITLKNNYETLTFTREMRSVLDENSLPLSPQASEKFNIALNKQEHNITEPGEREATANLAKAFSIITNQQAGLNLKLKADSDARLHLNKIEGLNMLAIVNKNNEIHATVTLATLYLGGMGFITFFILFILIANFPGFILNPLNQITDSLQEIGEKNYNARLNFTASDEFLQLSDAFNRMAAMLADLDNFNRTKIITCELTIKKLIEAMPDAVIGTDENGKILFMNAAAKEILKLDDKKDMGVPVSILAKHNAILKDILENKTPEQPIKLNIAGSAISFKQENFEIVAPNLKLENLYTLQFAGFPAGMIYILTKV